MRARNLRVSVAIAVTAVLIISTIVVVKRHHRRVDPTHQTAAYLRDEWHARAASCIDALRSTLAGDYGGPPDRQRIPPYTVCLSVDHHNDEDVGLISYGYPSARGFSREKPCGTRNEYSGY